MKNQKSPAINCREIGEWTDICASAALLVEHQHVKLETCGSNPGSDIVGPVDERQTYNDEAKEIWNFCFITIMGGSPGDVSENPVTWETRKKGWRMSCDVGEAMEGLENDL